MNQPTLPIGIRETVEVNATIGEKVRRRGILNRVLGRTTVKRLEEEDGYSFKKSIIDADDITPDNYHDPELRYALRLAAAAKAAGWFEISEYTEVCARVDIVMTNDGPDSRLLRANYSGSPFSQGSQDDSFMDDLRRLDTSSV